MGMLKLRLLMPQFFEGGTGGTSDGQGSGDGGASGAGGAGTGTGTGGSAGTGTGAGAAGGTGAGGATNPDKTFNQAEVDRIVNERLRRERSQFADYDTLKAEAEEFRALKETQKTEAQKAAEAQAQREATIAARETAASQRLIQAEVRSLVIGRVHNPDHVIALLASDPKIKVKGDSVDGAKDVVDAFLADEANKYFLKEGAGASRSGGEFNGRDNKTLDERIAAAEAAGDWKLSNSLKMQKLRAAQT